MFEGWIPFSLPRPSGATNVRFWHLADINAASQNVRFWG